MSVQNTDTKIFDANFDAKANRTPKKKKKNADRCVGDAIGILFIILVKSRLIVLRMKKKKGWYGYTTRD